MGVTGQSPAAGLGRRARAARGGSPGRGRDARCRHPGGGGRCGQRATAVRERHPPDRRRRHLARQRGHDPATGARAAAGNPVGRVPHASVHPQRPAPTSAGTSPDFPTEVDPTTFRLRITGHVRAPVRPDARPTGAAVPRGADGGGEPVLRQQPRPDRAPRGGRAMGQRRDVQRHVDGRAAAPAARARRVEARGHPCRVPQPGTRARPDPAGCQVLEGAAARRANDAT